MESSIHLKKSSEIFLFFDFENNNKQQKNKQTTNNDRKIKQVAERHGLIMHLDGARLWNASIASGISLQEYGGYFDSVSIHLLFFVLNDKF